MQYCKKTVLLNICHSNTGSVLHNSSQTPQLKTLKRQLLWIQITSWFHFCNYFLQQFYIKWATTFCSWSCGWCVCVHTTTNLVSVYKTVEKIVAAVKKSCTECVRAITVFFAVSVVVVCNGHIFTHTLQCNAMHFPTLHMHLAKLHKAA